LSEEKENFARVPILFGLQLMEHIWNYCSLAIKGEQGIKVKDIKVI